MNLSHLFGGVINPELLRQSNLMMANAANQPIPGLTGPVSSGAGIPGLLSAPPSQGPGLNQIPSPMPQAHSQFTPSGPFGQQAMQMAGLLSAPMQTPVKRGFRIPGGK